MTKFEFDSVMDHFGQSKKTYYLLYEVQFHHDDMDSVIVRGNIPVDLAKLIYNRYDSWGYGIRINGQMDADEPNEDINLIYIDDVDGLVAFILELAHYRCGIKSTLSALDYHLDQINNEMIKKVDTDISDLMERIDSKIIYGNIEDGKIDSDSLDYTQSLFELNQKLIAFDMGINPFSGLDKDNYNNSFIVRGYNKNYYSLYDSEEDIELETKRTNHSFYNNLIINDADPYKTVLSHSFDENGEKISLDYYGVFGTVKIDYNLTYDVFTNHLGQAYPAGIEEIKALINLLDSHNEVLDRLKERHIHIKDGFERKLK